MEFDKDCGHEQNQRRNFEHKVHLSSALLELSEPLELGEVSQPDTDQKATYGAEKVTGGRLRTCANPS